MEYLAEILEQKLADACEIKNRDALHSCVLLLTERIVERSEFEKSVQATGGRIEELLALMREESRINRQRFEQIDKRFEDLFHYMDMRFEQVDKRIEQVDKRFDQVDKRFEDLIHYMDKRFEDLIHYLDKRFDQVDKRFNTFQWLIGSGLTLIVILMTVFEFIR